MQTILVLIRIGLLRLVKCNWVPIKCIFRMHSNAFALYSFLFVLK